MARVNHKLVKQRLNEKRSKITDKQFFSSRMLAGHFEDLAAAQPSSPCEPVLETKGCLHGGNGQYADPYQHGASVGDQGQRTRESVSARVRYVCT